MAISPHGIEKIFSPEIQEKKRKGLQEGEMNPLSDDEAHFCFFLLKFSRKMTHLMGVKTSSENETFENKKTFFEKKILKKYFSKVSFSEDVSSP